MFEVTLDSIELSKALGYIEPAVENGMIYLESTKLGECILYSENKECAISISLICSNSPIAGTTDYIDYKIFEKVVNSLSDKKSLTIRQEDNSPLVTILYEHNVKPIELKTMSLPLLTKNPLATNPAPSDAASFKASIFCGNIKLCTSIMSFDSKQSSVLDCCDIVTDGNSVNMSVVNVTKVIGCKRYMSPLSECNQEEFVMNLKPLKKLTSLFSSFKTLKLFQDANGICICSDEKEYDFKTGEDKLENVSEVRVILHKFASNYPISSFDKITRSNDMSVIETTEISNSLNRILALTDDVYKDVLLTADNENITMSIMSSHGKVEDKIPVKVGTNNPFQGKFDASTLKSIVGSNSASCMYISPSTKSVNTFVIGCPDSQEPSVYFINSKALKDSEKLDTTDESDEEINEENIQQVQDTTVQEEDA